MRFNSPARSTVFSQPAIAAAVSSPMLRTRRSSLWGRLKNLGRVAEMFQQQPGAHRPDVLDEIQRDERFP